MMKAWHGFKKVVSVLLILVMLFSTYFPTPPEIASADGVARGQTSVSNSHMMQMLIDEYGAEQAPALYQTIKDLGLVDNNGDWINHQIDFNGKSYTMEEMKLILADENTDLTQTARVDGQSVSLDVLKKMVGIEENIEAIRQQLPSDDLKMTSKHLDSLESLITQAGNEGIEPAGGDNQQSNVTDTRLLSTNTSGNYRDETVVSITSMYKQETRTAIEFSLNGSKSDPVSFSYEIMEVSSGESDLRAEIVYDSPYQGVPPEITPLEEGDQITLDSEKRHKVLYIYDEKEDVGSYDPNTDLDLREQEQEKFRNNVWIGRGREDYIHFSNFENLDYMKFEANSVNGPNYSFTPFTHTYNGGAYIGMDLLYGSGNGSYSSGSYSRSNLWEDGESIDLDFTEDAQILEVNAGEGTYTTDQIVPIRVVYDNIVHQAHEGISDSKLHLANGDTALSPKDVDGSGFSFVRAYQAIVKKNMKPDDLIVERTSGGGHPQYYYEGPPFDNRDLKDRVHPDMAWDKPFTNDPDIEIIHARSDAFQSIETDRSEYKIGDTATVTVNLNNDDLEAGWIIDGVPTPEEISKLLKVSIGNKEDGLIDLDWKVGADGEPVSPATLEGTFEITEDIFDLMSEDNREDGKLRAKVYYNRDKDSNEEDLEDFGLLLDQFAYFTIAPLKYIQPEDLAITYPETWASGEPNTVELTNPMSTKLRFTFPEDATYTDSNQFEWKSNSEEIATIQADGTIVPKGVGKVTFTLTAKNGNDDKQIKITSEKIKIVADGTAKVVVPDFANHVYAEKNQNAPVLWTTNVMDIYKELAGPDEMPENAHFTVELYKGDWNEVELEDETPVETWSAPDTKELTNATSFTIPESYVNEISTGNTPSYTVRIQTKDPERSTRLLSALAYIVVRSEPVKVTMNKSMEQYVTDDTSPLTFDWTMEHFDVINGEFEFKVTKNGKLVPESLIEFDKTDLTFNQEDVTIEGGSYTLDVDPVSKTESFKDIYAITIAARNDPDSGWSRDSFYLQAYNTEALNIQIDGQSKSNHTMSNIDTIKNMTSNQILDLNRHIDLKNEMGINSGDFTDMGDLTDQFAWESSDDRVGVINLRRGNYFGNINKLDYPTYQPRQRFDLSGVGNGDATITATHAKTGMETELNLTVETLKDKLYLFQFYPKTKTEFTYTDNVGKQKTLTSTDNGEFALFEEDGISSDIYVTSEYKDTTYTGVLDQKFLLSQEKDPASMELYPTNILQLRQLAKVETFFKTPDGAPYTGDVTYRGGVYKNGNYAEPAEIGGEGVTEKLDSDGKLEVIFDTTDFYSEEAGETNAANLSAKDDINFVLEVHFADERYLPKLLTIDGNANLKDRIVFSEKIETLIENDKQNKSPFMASQQVTTPDTDDVTEIVQYNGKFGPNNQIPDITLTTDIMWWGEKADDQSTSVELTDENGMKPKGQSYTTFKYPFSDETITRHVQVLNDDTMWLEKGESGPTLFRLYEKPGELRKSFSSESTLVNMIGVEEISTTELMDKLDDIKQRLKEADSKTESPSNNDKILGRIMRLLGSLKIEAGGMKMKVYPTEDPMVFKTIIDMSESSEGYQSSEGSELEFFDNQNISVTPGIGDVYKMAQNTYLSDKKKQYEKATNRKRNSDGNLLFSAGGYYVGELRYNPERDKWEDIVLGGGFEAGGGYEFSQNWNMTVGPVPVTATLAAGGLADVEFNASVLYDETPGNQWNDDAQYSVNDYLTTLRLAGYAEFFGGLGFDYSVVAVKIGAFGRLSIQNTSTWLNRDYLEDSDRRVRYGNKFALEGAMGIRAVLKFLFVNVSHEFASLRYSDSWVYNNWNEIYDYWNRHGNEPLSAANVDNVIVSYMKHIGVDDVYEFNSQTLEGRDYLSKYEREWNTNSSRLFRMMSIENDSPDVLQSNAYPYSNPKVAQDGSLFVHLSDSESDKIEDTVASWAIKNGNGFVDKGKISTESSLDGYGDSNLQIAGEGDLIAAAWVRQTENIDKRPGEAVTNEEILLMNNSTEIMVAIYDGEEWTTQQVTDNDTPDLAPVLSVTDGKVSVVYRSVYSANVDNPLDFSSHETIQHTVYDTKKSEWSDTETIYNGTNGTVMGLSTESLSDGTTAVVYSVDQSHTEQQPDEEDIVGSDNQIIYTVINPDGEVVKSLQVTNDQVANENPQVVGVTFPDENERFILGWHTTSKATSGDINHDIHLLSVDKDGEIDANFVESLDELNMNHGTKIEPNFTFVKMPDKDKHVNNLSIMWKESEMDTDEEQVQSHDMLKAVKFTMDDDKDMHLSGVIDVGTMPDYTEVDTIDAFLKNDSGLSIRALVLGTTYTTDMEEVGTITPSNQDKSDDIPVYVSETVSDIYTVNTTYKNEFKADNIILNPEEIVSGFDLPIKLEVANQGVSEINKAEITIDGKSSIYDEDLSILPNSSNLLTYNYEVPEQIKDVKYRVDVTFADGEKLSTDGKLKLDIPDLGISKIRMTAEDGKRGLSIPLYNLNDTTLDNKDKVVKFGLYQDNIFDDDHLIGDEITISNKQDLQLIDDAGYVANIDFDLKNYLQELDLLEVPKKGLTIHLHAWVEDKDGNKVTEFDESNNQAKILMENLAEKNNNEDILLTLEQANSETHTTVDLTMQNMNMAEIPSGNVLLNLMDAEGNIMESKYLATTPDELLRFSAEEKKTRQVKFSQSGDTVEATFFEESPKQLDSTLSSLTVEGVQLDFDSSKYDYTLETKDLNEVRLTATASNRKATVTLLNEEEDAIQSNDGNVSAVLELQSSEQGASHEFTIAVQPEGEEGEVTNYHVTITNKKTDAPNLHIMMSSGTQNQAGEFLTDVGLGISKFDVTGYNIDKAMYRINDGEWIDVVYDGKSEGKLTDVSEPGQYTVDAKVVLTSGREFTLDSKSFEIVTSKVDMEKSTIVASENEPIADGEDSAILEVTLQDAYGHVLEGIEAQLRADSDDTVIDANDGKKTDEQGKVRYKVTNTIVETVKYTAQSVSNAEDSWELSPISIVFNPIPVDTENSSVSLSNDSVEANGEDDTTITVVLRSESGDVLIGREVGLTANGGSHSSITPDNATTDEDGKATFTVTDEVVETVEYTAQDKVTGVKLSSVKVDFIPGDLDVTKSSVTTSKSKVTANGSEEALISVTLKDSNGHAINGREVLLTADGGSSVIETNNSLDNIGLTMINKMYGTKQGNEGNSIINSVYGVYGKGFNFFTNPEHSALTDAKGEATFKVINTKAETVTYKAIDAASETVLGTVDIDFVAGAVDADRSSVAASDMDVLANGEEASSITVTLRDANGNVVSGHEVELQADSSDTKINPVKNTTNAEGVAIFKVTNETVGTVEFTAVDVTSELSIKGEVQVNFIIGDLDKTTSSVTASASEVVADEKDQSIITITLLSTSGHPLGGHEVSLTADGGSSAVVEQNGITNEEGEAHFTVTNGTVEDVEYTAKDETSEVEFDPIQVSFIPGDLSEDISSITGSKTDVVADGTDHSVITVTLIDINGHTVSGRKVSLDTDGGSSIVEALHDGVTDVKGQATFKVTNKELETVKYTAQIQDEGLKLPVITVEFGLGELNLTNSGLSVSYASTPIADGEFHTTLKVSLKDSGNHALSGRKVLISASSDHSIMEAVNDGITDENGETIFKVANTAVESVEYSIQDETSKLTFKPMKISFFNAEDDYGQSTVETSSDNVIANGVDSATITVTLKDKAGNGISDRTIGLEPGDPHSSEIKPVQAQTNSRGEATFTVTNTELETIEYSAYDQRGNGSIGSVKVNFVTGEVDAKESGISVNQNEIPINGKDPAEITVTLRDASNHVLEGRNVRLITKDDKSVITPSEALSNDQGEVTFEVRRSELGTVEYKAQDIGSQVILSSFVEVAFVEAEIDADNSSVEATKKEVIADGIDWAVIEVTVKDEQGREINDHVVELHPLIGHENYFGIPTNNKGKAHFFVSNKVVESVTYKAIDAVSGIEIGTVDINFVPGDVDAETSSVKSSNTLVTADGEDHSTITVILKDGSGHVISDRKVTLSSDSNNSEVEAENGGVTNEDGEAIFLVTNKVEETVAYTARDEEADLELSPVEVTFTTSIEKTLYIAEQLLQDHSEGLAVGQASAEARMDLQEAINNAQAIADDAENYTQAQLNATVRELEDEITKFKKDVDRDNRKLELSLRTNGDKQSDGTYKGDVEIDLLAEKVEGYEIEKAMFKVNDRDWETVTYNGIKDKHLMTLSNPGTYKISAKVRMENGEEQDLQPVTLEIVDTTPPVLELKGNNPLTLHVGEEFKEPGYKVSDDSGEDLTNKVQVSGTVDMETAGTYTLNYSVSDSSGNSINVKRMVEVIGVDSIVISEKPTIMKTGGNSPLQVIATFNDGTTANVTNLTTYESSHPKILTIEKNGNLKAQKAQIMPVTVTADFGEEKEHFSIIVVDQYSGLGELTPTPLDAGQLFRLQGTGVFLQLPDDLPNGTTITTRRVHPDTSELDKAGDVINFDLHLPKGNEDYTGDYQLTMDIDKTTESSGIYYHNEKNKAWSYIGGKIDNESITARVSHFSTYGVFNDTSGPTQLTLSIKDKTDQSLSMVFSAKDPSGIAEYRLMRDGKVIIKGTSNKVTDKGLESGKTYEYTLRVTDAFGNETEKTFKLSTQSAPSSNDGKKEKDGNDNSNGATHGSDNGHHGQSDNRDVEKNLPGTNSGIYNWVLIGGVLLMLGISILLLQSRLKNQRKQ